MPTDDSRDKDYSGTSHCDSKLGDEDSERRTQDDLDAAAQVRPLVDKLRHEEAKRLSLQYGLDYEYLRVILNVTANRPFDSLDAVEQLEFIQEYGLVQRPSLALILERLPREEAIELLENRDEMWQIGRNQQRITAANHLFRFYTLDELANVTSSFIHYLNHNRRHLVEFGFPKTSFEEWDYIEFLLGRLYFFKGPAVIEKAEVSTPEKKAEASRKSSKYHPRECVYKYTWTKEAELARFTGRSRGRVQCTYEEADFLPGLDPETAERLYLVRNKFLDLKLRILDILVRAIHSRQKGLFENCLQVIADSLTTAEIQLCHHMDTFYRGLTEDRSGDAISPFLPPAAGGLADLFLVIWHFDQELDVGPSWRTREALAEVVEIDSLGRPMASEHKYLCTIGTPRWKAINDALDRLTSFNHSTANALERYRRRVSEMLIAKLVQDIGRGSLIAPAPELQPPPSALTRTPEDDRRAPDTPTELQEHAEKVLVIQDSGLFVTYYREVVKLTPTERKVLIALAERSGKSVAVGDLGRAGWGPDGPNDLGNVRSIISQIRGKLAHAARQAANAGREVRDKVIETRRGRFGPAAYELLLRPFEVVVSD